MTDSDLKSRILELLAGGDTLSCREIAAACAASRRSVAQLLHTELRPQVARDALFCWRLCDEDDVPVSSIDGIDASSRTFVASFLDRRGLARPDGRELYKYRGSEAEFEALHLAISDVVDFDPLGRSRHLFAPLFVLYAAEWWRRHQGTGAWVWEPVFESLELRIGNIMSIYDVVIAGLDFWKRPLLKVQDRRMFLITLGCEGGLPLQLMKQEGARLRTYFREVLEDYGAYLRTGISAAEVARRNEAYLPRSLRQEIVLELAGQLVETIWELQEKVRGTQDPVSELDRIDARWREQLPLEIDDSVAKAFLNNLVQTAHRIRQGASEDFRLTRYLIRGSEWALHAELSFPPSVDATKMNVVTGLAETDVPSRGQFVLVSSAGRKLPAVNVTKRFRRDGADYVLERLGGRAHIAGREAAQGWAMQFDSLRGSTRRRDFRGSGALGDDAPWSFGEVEEGRWRFLGQGSLKTRASECVVLLPAGLSTEEGEPLGEWQGREIRRIDHSIELVHAEAGRYRIQLGQSEEQANAFRIAGDQFSRSPDEREVFHGLPAVVEVLGDDHQRKVAEDAIQWRPIGSREWHPWSVQCAGRVAIRVVHRDETRFTQTVDILPAEFKVSLHGASASGGEIELRFPSVFHARPMVPDAITATTTRADDGFTVHLLADGEAEVPATATLQLDLGNDRHLQLVLPFPARGVRYIGPGDRLLAREDAVSVAVLALTHLDLFATGVAARRTIDGTLSANDLKPGELVALAVDLPDAVNGRVSYELRRLVPQVQELLSQTGDGEAFVSLEVDGVPPNRLNVRKYDVDIALSEHNVYATFSIGGRRATEEDACFEMIPMWRPAAVREPVLFDEEVKQWRTAIMEREAGPWLLVARTSSGLAVRPRLLQAPGDIGGRSLLAAAISEPSKVNAQAAVKQALAQLVDRPLDEDWPAVVSVVKLAAELPSSSFFVMTELCRNLDAAVLALIHAGADRQLVWDTLEEFGVEWSLVPYGSWKTAVERYGQEFRTALGEYEMADQLVLEGYESLLEFLENGAERLPMRPLWSFLRWHLFKEKDSAVIGRVAASLVPPLRAARNGLLARETMSRRWPTPPRLSENVGRIPTRLRTIVQQFATAQHQKVVFGAPFIAAWCVADGKSVGRHVRGEFRRVRRFDPEWFDAAYQMALIMELNRTHEQEILDRR